MARSCAAFPVGADAEATFVVRGYREPSIDARERQGVRQPFTF